MSSNNLDSTCSDPACQSRGTIKTDLKASAEVPTRMKELPKNLTKEAFETCELSPISFGREERHEVKVHEKIYAPSVLSNSAKYGSVCLVVRRPG